jgi:septum formation topological specificity factor MinE
MVRSQAVGRTSCKLDALWRLYVPARNDMMMMMDNIQNELLYIITKHIQTLEEITVNACARLFIIITMI